MRSLMTLMLLAALGVSIVTSAFNAQPWSGSDLACAAPQDGYASRHRTSGTQDVELLGQIGGTTGAVALDNGVAYVGVGPRLTAYDLSSPGSPVVLGRSGVLKGVIEDIVVSGELAFIAARDAGLYVLNISAPAWPAEVSFCATPGEALGIASAGDRVYVADGYAGLRVIDVSNPAAPAEIGFCDTPSYAKKVAISGHYAYVADYDSGLQIIDTSDLDALVAVGFGMEGLAHDVALKSNWVFVAESPSWDWNERRYVGGGLRVLDVCNPLAPRDMALIGESRYGSAVTVSEHRAYVGYIGPVRSGFGVIDVSDPSRPFEVSFHDDDRMGVRDVAVSGDFAYLACDDRGLQTIRISGLGLPGEPVRFDTPGQAFGVAVRAGYAYIADGDAGLQALDVTDPAHPTAAGSFDTPGHARDVAIAGQYAYIADGDAGLRVVDISDPRRVVEVGSCDTPSTALAVTVVDGHAYVADGTAGLRIIEVGAPLHPREIGSVDTPGTAVAVAVAGSHAYVADTSAGLRIIDVGRPESPREVASLQTPGWEQGVAVAGSHVFIACGYGAGVRIVDVSDPAHPREVGRFYLADIAWELATSGNQLFVADSGGMHALDISIPWQPALSQSFDVGFGPNWDVVVDGEYSYIASDEEGLTVVNIANLASVREATLYDTPGFGLGVATRGSHAYMVDVLGLRIINVSDPSDPLQVALHETPGCAHGVALAGDYAFIAAGDAGLEVFHVGDTNAAAALTFWPFGQYAADVAVSGRYAYVLAQWVGLRIFDLSDPTAPAEIGSLDIPGSAYRLALQGTRAYLTCEEGGLRVIDVSDPAAPQELGSYQTLGNAYGVAAQAERVFVCDGQGLYILDVSDPSAPFLLSLYDIPGGPSDVEVVGNYAYISTYDRELYVIDVSDPAHPFEVGFSELPAYARGISIAAGLAYVADGDAGLLVLSVPFSQLMPTPTLAPLYCPEPANDHRSGACGPLMPGLTYQQYISEPDDQDWFYFDMATDHAVGAWLTSVPQACDYELYLIDSLGHRVAYSATRGNADEHISVPTQPSGRYYLWVFGADNTWHTTSGYRIKADFGQPGPTAVSSPTLWLPYNAYLPIIVKNSEGFTNW